MAELGKLDMIDGPMGDISITVLRSIRRVNQSNESEAVRIRVP